MLLYSYISIILSYIGVTCGRYAIFYDNSIDKKSEDAKGYQSVARSALRMLHTDPIVKI